MEHLDLNNLLNRKQQEQQLIDYLHYFEQNKHDLGVCIFMVIQELVKVVLCMIF